MPPGPLPAEGAYQAVATFVAYRSPDGYPHQRLDSVQAQVRITVVDALVRGADPVAAILADGRLAY